MKMRFKLCRKKNDILTFDIFDINYVKSHEDIDIFSNGYSSSFYILFKSIGIQLFSVTHRLLFRNFGLKKLNKNEYSFFGFTNNNKRAILPIQEKIDNSFLLDGNNLPIGKIGIDSLFFIPSTLRLYKQNKGYLKLSIANNFYLYCLSYSELYNGYHIIEKLNPYICIFANDHSHLSRALFRIAERMKIKTAYVQHASVTEYFPPLDYDYAFLDGMESFEKYIKNKSCNATVFLVGAARFDYRTNEFISIRNESKKKLGLAINMLDEKSKVEYFLEKILYKKDIECTIRPHPGQNMKEWKIVAEKFGCKFSPKEENPIDFIENSDIFIAGESSIHLDIAIRDKKSYYYNFTNRKALDYYGYIKKGLTTDITNFSMAQISKLFFSYISNDDSLIRYYVANYKTKYWGKSSELIAKTIENLIKNNKYPDFWAEKTLNTIKYFELL